MKTALARVLSFWFVVVVAVLCNVALFFSLWFLRDLDNAVDLSDEVVASEETDGSSQNKESDGHDAGVTEVEKYRDELGDLELGEEVEDGVKEHVEGRSSRGEVSSPPPVVVFATELEVAHHDGDLGAGENQNDKHDRQETKDVVELVQPERRKDEEEFDEDGTEGKYASHQNRKGWLHIPDLLGDLSWDLVGSHWWVLDLLLVSEIASEEDKRDGDTEPKSDESHECAEWNSTRRAFNCEHKIENEEDGEDDAGEKHGGDKHVLLPVNTLEHLVDSCREVTSEDTHNDKQDNHCSHQTTTVCWRQKSEDCENHGDESHREDLDTSANEHREEEWATWWTENVTVDEFPTGFFLSILLVFHFSVAANIGVEGAHHNHGNHTGQEENNHEGVDDREPMDLIVGHQKVDVPARSPLDVLVLPLDGVSPNNSSLFLSRDGERLGGWVLDASVGIFLQSVDVSNRGIMVNAFSLDFETDNATSSLHSLGSVVENSHVDVVVEVDLSIFSTINVLSLNTQWETKVVDEGLVVVSIDHWLSNSSGQVIKDPVDAVILFDSFRKVLQLVCGQLGDAQYLANIVDTSFDFVQRVFDSVTSKDFAEIFNDILNRVWCTERKRVVRIRELCVRRSERVDFQSNKISVFVILWSYSRKIKGRRSGDK